MKITIFTGGSGSIALQTGLYEMLDRRIDGIHTKIIVNAYDNGLSTGKVREVMDGQILGPSDVRKNHATRLQLQNPVSPWLEFLSERFTVESSKAQNHCTTRAIGLVDALGNQKEAVSARALLMRAIEAYFDAPLSKTIPYVDFSLANIIYAGLARLKGNSLRSAASLMALAMGIPDNVLLNDDESLFLGAVTQSGKEIWDEGEIVSWCNETDPFVDIFFTDNGGTRRSPTLCLEAWTAIVESDLIVLSCGTQWSSLIPTYASDGFSSAIGESKASIVLLMNRIPDKDSPGQTATDIVKALVPRYFEPRRLHVLADENGDVRMNNLSGDATDLVSSFTRTRLSGSNEKAGKYNPRLLADAISAVFFKEYLDSNFYLFDYDDTLVGRAGRQPAASLYNIQALVDLNSLVDVGICTGNAISSVRLQTQLPGVTDASTLSRHQILVFADGGVNEYLYDTEARSVGDEVPAQFVKCIKPAALLHSKSINNLMERLTKAKIPSAEVENRGDALIAIKPVPTDCRQAVMCMIRHIIRDVELEVRESGSTTIEICRSSLSKLYAVTYVQSQLRESALITYIGDECLSGNDSDIYAMANEDSRLRCLRVDSPAMTSFFLCTLIRHLSNYAAS